MPITSRSVLVCLVVGLVVAVIASSAAALPRFQQTLVLIKPEAVQNHMVGGIISELEKIKGLYLAAIRLVQPTPALAREHYAEHASKSWFPDLEKYFISGPVVVMIWEGIDAVPLVRERIGTTDPAKSPPNTIRAKFGTDKQKNAIHASAVEQDAEREIALWFGRTVVEELPNLPNQRRH